MKKILSLTTQDFFKGIAQGYFIGNGLWANATGINPFISSRIGGARAGLLQAAPAVTDDTGAVVIDTPIGWTVDFDISGNKAIFFSGTGTFYTATLTQTNVADETARRTVANMANGLGVFQANGGTKYLYYWQKTQIGRWDFSAGAGGFTDAQYTGLQSTVHHPTHRFLDVLFYGNKDRIGSLRDDGAAGVTHTLNELDFGSDYICTTLSDDGRYLVIGITKNTGGSSIFPGTKILFWDTNSSSWEKEWDLPAANIISIKKVGSALHALTSSGLFVFNYDTAPIKVVDFGINDQTTGVSATTGAHYSMDRFGDGVLWGDSLGKLHYYGKAIAGVPNGYHHLFSVPSGTATMVVGSISENLVIVGTTTPKFGHYDIESGTPNTTVSAATRYLDLIDRYSIQRIDVIFGAVLASGDSVNVSVETPEYANADFGGTNAASFANFGAVTRAKLSGSVEAESLIINFTFVAGAPKIKRIDVWGDKIDT